MSSPDPVSSVVLFTSAFSNNGKDCEEIIKRYQIPVVVVPLDNPKIRKQALAAFKIPVKNVPVLVVTKASGEQKVFIGKDKVNEWLNYVHSKREEVARNVDESRLGIYSSTGSPQTSKVGQNLKSKKKKRKPKNTPSIEGAEEFLEVETIVMPKGDMLKGSDEEDYSISPSDDQGRPQGKSKNSGLSTQPGPKTQGSSLMAEAAKLMALRESAMGEKT